MANGQKRTLHPRPPSRAREATPIWPQGDPEAVRPLQRGEGMPVFVAGVILALVSLAICYRHGYTLLYGDAVAHLGNARRILDAKYPGLAQLGGVWLPLPHVLMLPFIMNTNMWQTGLAAAPMSMVSFAASVVGLWRLSRRMMRVRWALVATAFYALNPNLLYAATTALTETLFLALFVWSVVGLVECVAALRAHMPGVARRRLVFTGIMVLLEVFTRYDGWVMGAVVWCLLAWSVWRCPRELRRRVTPAFLACTLLCVAGPLLWFWYNAHFDGDWLGFLRGPYSAKAIERRTSHPGQHYPGWHNPLLALVYFTRAAQIDAAAWELGFGVMVAALFGTYVSLRPANPLHLQSKVAEVEDSSSGSSAVVSPSRNDRSTPAGGEGFATMLWAPVPFYCYSVAFGAVPIFLPQLAPHAFYNVRYGMELLPALCLYSAAAGERLELWLRSDGTPWRQRAAHWIQPVVLVGCLLNCVLMMAGMGSAGFLRGEAIHQKQMREAFRGGYSPAARRWAYPLVLQEGLVNAQTRVPFEQSLAHVLEAIPENEPVLMSTTAHVGALQVAGRPLRSMVSEADEQAWEAALADPARHAAFVIAMDGDPVAAAVARHPEGLAETEVIRSTGQPATRVFQSSVWKAQATR